MKKATTEAAAKNVLMNGAKIPNNDELESIPTKKKWRNLSRIHSG